MQVTAAIDLIIKEKVNPVLRLVFLEGVSDNSPKSNIIAGKNLLNLKMMGNLLFMLFWFYWLYPLPSM